MLDFFFSFVPPHPYCALQHDNEGRPFVGPSIKKEPTMFVTYVLSRVRAYLRYRETVRELAQLTDRELEDLGINRFQIEAIAREHAAA